MQPSSTRCKDEGALGALTGDLQVAWPSPMP